MCVRKKKNRKVSFPSCGFLHICQAPKVMRGGRRHLNDSVLFYGLDNQIPTQRNNNPPPRQILFFKKNFFLPHARWQELRNIIVVFVVYFNLPSRSDGIGGDGDVVTHFRWWIAGCGYEIDGCIGRDLPHTWERKIPNYVPVKKLVFSWGEFFLDNV